VRARVNDQTVFLAANGVPTALQGVSVDITVMSSMIVQASVQVRGDALNRNSVGCWIAISANNGPYVDHMETERDYTWLGTTVNDAWSTALPLMYLDGSRLPGHYASRVVCSSVSGAVDSVYISVLAVPDS
jgi:hypothetical protein